MSQFKAWSRGTCPSSKGCAEKKLSLSRQRGENQLSVHPQAPSTKQTHFLIEEEKRFTIKHPERKRHKPLGRGKGLTLITVEKSYRVLKIRGNEEEMRKH
ncbi:uncharacterized [Tachysurus ichikawai]